MESLASLPGMVGLFLDFIIQYCIPLHTDMVSVHGSAIEIGMQAKVPLRSLSSSTNVRVTHPSRIQKGAPLYLAFTATID